MAEIVDKTRRKVSQLLLGIGSLGVVGSALFPLIRFLVPPEVAEAVQNNVVAAREDELPPGSGKIFKFGTKPGILIRTPEGEYRAFSAICTHLNCTVQFRKDIGHIWCACHNGHYDLNGQVISGPPPRPLPEFKVNIRDGVIYVSKS